MRVLLAALLLLIPGGSDELPPLPQYVRGAHGPVPIHYVENLYCGTVKAWGCYDERGPTFSIQAGLSRADAYQVIYHEEVHMAARDAGIPWPKDTALQEIEQRLADAIAAQRMRQMLRGEFPLDEKP